MTSVLVTQTISLLFKGLLYVHFSRETSSLGAKSPIQPGLLPLPASEMGTGESGLPLIQRAPAGCIPISLLEGKLFPIT